MDHRRFDALTRGLAATGTWRSLLRGVAGVAGVAGVTAGGMAVVGLGQQARSMGWADHRAARSDDLTGSQRAASIR